MIKRVSNPPRRFSPQAIEWLEAPPPADLEVYEERARSIISANDSPDLAVRFTINPYRGCFHGCSYCYARAYHEYIDFGAGTDFDRKIVVKVNAPERLTAEFLRPSWNGELLGFSGVTDCYQPLEAHYELTRRCLEVCLRFRNPVGIVTKALLIRRDKDLLARLHEQASVKVYFSIAFADDALSTIFEPNAPRPSARFRAMRELADAGVPVAVGIAPVIPGLNETHIPEILERAKASGAQWSFMNLVRLPPGVEEVFTARLDEELPEQSKKILRAIRRLRGGKLDCSKFGDRFSGEGKEWEAIEWLYETTARRLGYVEESDQCPKPPRPRTFERPQLSLFRK